MMQNVFTKTLERITKETGLVGGVAIVFKNGEITFAAPYGYEDRENDIPMTLNASFDIASCSKAWTVMLAAQAVDEGLIGWDEPVQHAMKDFDMPDHYAGAHLSIRDMASHRSGLPCHDFMRNKVGESRRNLMLKCANLDASAGFRETYQYNNHMYIVLGYLMEVLRGGESWESQIKRNIADKLGVETIRFRGLPGNMDNLERALPYVSDGYAAHRCEYSDSPLSGPCGGIKLNVKDLSKWVMAMARGGVCESGERLCSAAQYAAMTSPVIPSPEEDMDSLRGCCYGLGWHTGVYNGRDVVFHSGGLEGFNTQVGFIKGENSGYAMIFNTGTTPASVIARTMALDMLTTGAPKASYDDMIDAWLKKRDDMIATIKNGVEGEDVTIENAPQLIGTYEHPAYETFDVENRGGRLWFSYGSFETPLSFAKADGMICGYTGRLDGLVPDHIELWPDGNDLRLRTSDSELKMLFRKIK